MDMFYTLVYEVNMLIICFLWYLPQLLSAVCERTCVHVCTCSYLDSFCSVFRNRGGWGFESSQSDCQIPVAHCTYDEDNTTFHGEFLTSAQQREQHAPSASLLLSVCQFVQSILPSSSSC